MQQQKKFSDVQAIFFDNDGILVDTEYLYFLATKQVLADEGIDLTEQFYVKKHLRGIKPSFELLRDTGMDESEVWKRRAVRNEVYAKMLQEDDLFIPGVQETLEMLHGNVQMGVVTASRKEHYEIILQRTGYKKYFDFFVMNEDVKNSKPDPEPYLLALERSEKQPEHCLVIEDSERGLQAAVSAGLRCIAIPNALTKNHDFSSADLVLNSIREVPGIVMQD